MYCLGERRSVTFSPRAMRSRSRWRIFSRSSDTAFMRRPRLSPATSGMAKVNTVAPAAMAAKIIASRRVSCSLSIRKSSIARILVGAYPYPKTGTHFWGACAVSEVEVDHLLHHHHADEHPRRAAGEHHAAERGGPQKLDVGRAGDVDEQHHGDRQRADDGGRGLPFHRHAAHFPRPLLPVASHPP